MAEKFSIPIGGDFIDVPAWATTENLQELIKIEAGSLKALTAMLQNNKIDTNRAIRSNKELLKDLKDTVKKTAEDSGKQDQEQIKSVKDLLSLQKIRNHLAAKQSEYEKNFDRNMQNSLQNLNKNMKDMPGKITSSLDKGSLKDIATALGSVAGLGAVAGAAVGVIEGFAKNLTVLSNSGVGLTTGLQDLRGDAARAGLNLENYGKIIQANGRAINSLGTTTDEGARRFAALSNELRISARQFGQFGLSNTEYNEILAEEIDLRRRAGMSQDQITRSVGDSMNNLLQETTALAAVTGQDRRDMLRNRQSILADPVIESARALLGGELPESIGNIGAIVGGLGEEGAVFAGALAQAAVTDIPFFSTSLGQSLREMVSVGGPEIQSAFQDIANFVDQNALTMDPEEFNNQLVSMIGGLGDIGPRARESLMELSTVGNESATRLLGFLNSLQGIETDINKIDAARDDVDAGLRANQGLLGLSSALEDTANKISASAINTAFDTLGVDIQEAGADLTGAIRSIGDQFGPDKGLIEGMFSGTFTSMIAALGVLTVAVNGLAAVMGAGAIGGSIRQGLGRRGNTSRLGRFFGGGAAAGAGGNRGAMGRVAGSAARRLGPLGALIGIGMAGNALMDDDLSSQEKGGAVGSAVGGAGGAAGGAIAGAALGSIVPGVGTAIGGIVGGIIGGLGGDLLGGAIGSAIGENMDTPEVDTEAIIQDSLTQARIAEIEQTISDKQGRIARSEAGENEYWGSETSGRESDRETIARLQTELANLRTPRGTSTSVATSNRDQMMLNTHGKLLSDFNTANSALSSFEAGAGEKTQIGFDQRLHDITGDGRIMGYADADTQAEYTRLRSARNSAGRSLSELEGNRRYQYARAKELAQAMGIENVNTFTAQGDTVSTINGQSVNPELLSDRERERLGIARQSREQIRSSTSGASGSQTPVSQASTQQSPQNQPMTQAQGDELIKELKENNRLQRKANETAEMNN